MSRKEDIVFVISPSIWYENMYPSGILYLSSYLKRSGFENIILDSRLSKKQIGCRKREKMLVDRIKEINPRLVCFSSTNREFDEIVRMNYALKSAHPDIVTIVGGAQPTYRYSDFLDNGFDFVGIGEGELTLLEFVRELFSGLSRWGTIQGLVWKDRGRITVNPARNLMSEEEMNSFSLLSYKDIDSRYFNINLNIIRGLPLRGALLLTSRGCPFNCSYCGCNLIFGRKLRFRSLERIDEEVKFLKNELGIEGVWIVDDTFTINREHVIAVAAILQKYSLIWGCQSRVDTIDEELMAIMRRSGCVQIDFGVESGSQRILDEIIVKKTNKKQVVQAFELARKHTFRTLANFMVGLPTETCQDLKETEEMADLIDADVYVFSIATPLPGTRLYEMVGENIKPSEYSLLDFNGGELTERLNKSEIKNLRQERLRLHRKYSLKSVRRLIFSPQIYWFFLKRKHKLQRMGFVLKFLADRCVIYPLHDFQKTL
jgi:anaerobic magnesium-protoporphyrin IX monomethyl ester cyclase